MNEELLLKYITGQATEGEKIRILNWLEEHPDNRLKFNRLKNTWVISKLPETKAPEASVLQYSRKIRHRKQNRRILGYGIAASLILLLSFQIFHQFNDYRQEIHFLENQQLAQLEYHTNKGVKGRVTLPDGSIVWLNSDSELKCPAQFSGDSREINFSGEGYFDVVKNPEKPMIVKLENGIQVIVKGTKFNLTSYKNDDNVSALLLSGNITVLRTKHSKQEEIKVKPNERIWIEKKERQKVNLTVPAETLPILGWKDGWLIFDETPIAEVLKKLERWHGMTFEVKDPAGYMSENAIKHEDSNGVWRSFSERSGFMLSLKVCERITQRRLAWRRAWPYSRVMARPNTTMPAVSSAPESSLSLPSSRCRRLPSAMISLLLSALSE